MSEVAVYQRVTLGQREDQFLRMIGIAKEMSAYDIYKDLNEGETDDGKARKLPDIWFSHHGDSMSYKNVHKRIKRLYELNLIEQIKDTVRHRNKIKYKLTSRGLLQLYTSVISHPVFTLSELLDAYKDDLILQTILFQYIRMETVQELIKIFDEYIFRGYLRECFEHIFSINIGTDMLTEKEFDGALKMKTDAMNYFVKKELSSLINVIVTSSIEPSYKDNFPNRVLIEDGKFMHLVENLRNDFRKGCENILYRR
jgi:hypothetical protein